MWFSFHRWGDVDTLCLRCGAQLGREWRETVLGCLPDGPLRRLLIGLGQGLGRLVMRALGRHGRHHAVQVGGAGPGGLLPDTPFRLYGLEGRPLGLGLRTMSWSASGLRGAVNAVALDYVAGDGQPLDRKLHLEQAAGVDHRMRTPVRELKTITGLVGEYSPPGQRGSYLDRGNVLKYWNLERICRTPRRKVVIHIDGVPVYVELVRWQEPQDVVLAHLVLGDRTVMAASVNVPYPLLLLMLKGMAPLR